MRHFLLLFLLSIAQLSIAQNVGIGTNTPHGSAALEVAGTDKGMLIPRMTMAQRMNIVNLTKGLTVYQIDNTEGYWYYDGTEWGQLMKMPTGGTQGQVITLCEGVLKWTNNGVCPITDASGNTYPTITIGTQVWMAENLRTTKYRDGSNIPVVTDNTQWANNFNNSTTLPMMCWYNNDQSTYTANKFGALYNWYAINPATNGNKNVCPTGWRVPTDAEWTTLTTFLGGESVAGGKMKSTGTQYWQSPNTDATNSSGWSGLPGGVRTFQGPFLLIGDWGRWWSSTENSTNDAWFRGMNYDFGDVGRNYASKAFGFSVRCLRD